MTIADADLNPPSRLAYVALRGPLASGSPLTGGFTISNSAPKRVLVRGIGPALAAFGVTGTLTDPRLRVYRDGALIGENDNWSPGTAEATVAPAITAITTDTGTSSTDFITSDAAMILTLAPGAYTAQVGSADNAAPGVALVEIYELP